MRVLTGIQPTNILHIGNYFGALKPAIELQREDELFMMIVDLHAITVPQEPEQLKKNIAFATAAYLAATRRKPRYSSSRACPRMPSLDGYCKPWRAWGSWSA
jgi:hypothetical protein